jgi:hypothetical protein
VDVLLALPIAKRPPLWERPPMWERLPAAKSKGTRLHHPSRLEAAPTVEKNFLRGRRVPE